MNIIFVLVLVFIHIKKISKKFYLIFNFKKVVRYLVLLKIPLKYKCKELDILKIIIMAKYYFKYNCQLKIFKKCSNLSKLKIGKAFIL